MPPCGYTGGKRKFAAVIVDHLLESTPKRVFDLCCGSGAITLELLARGFNPESIVCVDAGPWGLFWQKISTGTLDLKLVEDLFKEVAARSPQTVAEWIEQDIAKREPTTEHFLLLQAASFGSTPVWWDGSRWRRGELHVNRGYKARPYWEPGPSSKETKPRGTVFTPLKILARVRDIALAGKGLKALHGRVEDVELEAPGVVYLDPPYEGFSGYGVVLDIKGVIRKSKIPIYVSEGSQLEGAETSFRLSVNRKGASLNGKSTTALTEEWLNRFLPSLNPLSPPPRDPTPKLPWVETDD